MYTRPNANSLSLPPPSSSSLLFFFFVNNKSSTCLSLYGKKWMRWLLALHEPTYIYVPTNRKKKFRKFFSMVGRYISLIHNTNYNFVYSNLVHDFFIISCVSSFLLCFSSSSCTSCFRCALDVVMWVYGLFVHSYVCLCFVLNNFCVSFSVWFGCLLVVGMTTQQGT